MVDIMTLPSALRTKFKYLFLAELDADETKSELSTYAVWTTTNAATLQSLLVILDYKRLKKPIRS